jgi:hypothetical protein
MTADLLKRDVTKLDLRPGANRRHKRKDPLGDLAERDELIERTQNLGRKAFNARYWTLQKSTVDNNVSCHHWLPIIALNLATKTQHQLPRKDP